MSRPAPGPGDRQVHEIAQRLSLRAPQREGLTILHRVTELVPPRRTDDLAGALAAIRAAYPSVTGFDRDFPSLCFALATGVGKTRLMGAFVSYLHLAHGLDNFFVLAPNLTIYEKLIADFTPNTPKYVFRGISAFAIEPPLIITGDNYEQGAGVRHGRLPGTDAAVQINIFNISKINTEVRGGKSPRIKRLSEYLGESYFDYLSNLPDLVLLMDESHRYRAAAGIQAINELRPVLGLELTATPVITRGKQSRRFENIILDYPLAQAMQDGFVKEPAVVTRKDFDPSGMTPEALERLKLEDGIRLHEQTRVELETYARTAEQRIVKPFVLVIARDTTHAAELLELIGQDDFFDGHYRDKVIQVDSSPRGADEKDEIVERLLRVEEPDEPTEIVIHVNMLKEGWDVTNLYTIVPLRAAHARTLIEQTIGRGLRLPYGRRTGVAAVDRLSIVAHDRFQEIVDEARRADSPLQLQALELDGEALAQPTRTVISQPVLDTALGYQPAAVGATTEVAGESVPPAFETAAEQAIARHTDEVIRRLATDPERVPSRRHLLGEAVQAELVAEVAHRARPAQLALAGTVEPPDIAAVVRQATELAIAKSIDIPRIVVMPTGQVRSGFRPFQLDLSGVRYSPPGETLWLQYLRTGEAEDLGVAATGPVEARPEDYLVAALIDFNDISYDETADLLYDLAGQVVTKLRANLSEEDVVKVLRLNQGDLARLIHAQMQDHYWEEATGGYEARVSQGYTDLKPCIYTAPRGVAPRDFRQAPAERALIARDLFGGFARCLYPVQKFDSDTERILAVILDREAEKWFRPARGQFRIYYRLGHQQHEYQPDFVAETADACYLLEPKARRDLTNPDVLAKRDAATTWCAHATAHTAKTGGLPWHYALIPHDVIAENKTLAGLLAAADTDSF